MQNYLIAGLSDDITATGTREEWGAYFESLGGSVVDGGHPIAPTKAAVRGGKVSDASDDIMVGYYIIKAESLDAAVALVKQSPMANNAGCEARVYELTQM